MVGTCKTKVEGGGGEELNKKYGVNNNDCNNK